MKVGEGGSGACGGQPGRKVVLIKNKKGRNGLRKRRKQRLWGSRGG